MMLPYMNQKSKGMLPLPCYFILFGGKKTVRALSVLPGIQIETDMIISCQERNIENRLQYQIKAFMSFLVNNRSKSPTIKASHLPSPKYVLTSPEHQSATSQSINYQFLQLKDKGALQNILPNINKAKLGSPEKPRIFSPNKSSGSSKDAIKLKLANCKQKINRIQGMLLDKATPTKKTEDQEQRNVKLSQDPQNLEKIHYKSEKTSASLSSGTKSTPKATSSPVGSYIWLEFNGRQQIFRIIRFINEGCYGKVYLVQHVATNFICCLKVITKQGLTPQMKDQIAREILIQSYLSHPHIVAIYGHCHDEQNVFLLLEACLGGNLFQKLKATEGKGLPEKEVASTVKEACKALAYMHANDIIHRDIKPQNILLHEGVVKICDLGWAVHSPLMRNTRCGTPVYLSPEVLQCDLYDSKVDVWSIGVLTYELIFARIPFEIKCIEDLSKIISEDIAFQGRQISNEAKEYILRCLSKHARQRLTIAQALEHSFLIRESNRFRQTIN